MELSQEQKNIGYFLVKIQDKLEVIPVNSTNTYFSFAGGVNYNMVFDQKNIIYSGFFSLILKSFDMYGIN
jgi:hypothetical protein